MFVEAEDGSYDRTDEDQTERCYSLEEIKSALAAAGLEFVGVWSDFNFTAPDDTTERWYIAAKRPQNR